MKRVILCGDGMGDYPVGELGDKTPLQAAQAPGMKRIAASGKLYMVQTIPDGLPPGSDVANMGLLGYNAAENYTGRAPIEAAGAAIPMNAGEIAIRCNLVTVRDGLMKDYSAGHITTEEAHQLIEALQQALGRDGLTFHGGVSYRHLVILAGGPEGLTTEPPHEILDKEVAPYLPQGDGHESFRELMEASTEILANHPVNQARVAAGKNPATQIWLWGQGRALSLETYTSLYGLTGGVISAVDLVRGLGLLAGLQAPVIPGATGFTDTNYKGKVEAALKILDTEDFVYVHIEAPDECGHLGDAKLKTEAIEAFDENVVVPIWNALEEKGEAYRLMVTMDHRTPVSTRGHTAEPVPLSVLEGPVGPVEEETAFDEFVNEGRSEAMSYEIVRKFLG